MIRKLRHIAGVLTLTAATMFGAGLVAAGPASATDGNCGDNTIAQPTPVHSRPTDTSPTIKFKNQNEWVTGTCVYFSHQDPDGQHWFMTVYLGGGGFGYIWIQRLAFGQYHLCDDDGNTYTIGQNSRCPLTPG